MIRELQSTTPVHANLWHKGYSTLSLAGMLLVMSAYMLLTLTPLRLYGTVLATDVVVHVQIFSLLAYAVGMMVFGPICNWLTQRYRRGTVCIVSVAFYAMCALAHFFIATGDLPAHPYFVVGLRFVTGAFYGLALMVLYGTLVIDKTESWLRTRANHSAAWLARLAMAIGPIIAVILHRNHLSTYICGGAFGLAFVSAILMRVVSFPFKAPDEDVHVFSLDRFMMPQAWALFLFTACVFMCYGLLLAHTVSVAFYCMLLLGFLWALITEHWTSACSYNRRDLLVSALFVLMGMGMYFSTRVYMPSCLVASLIGAGLGMMGVKSQLAFIERSEHCRRGTAVSSFFLSCEMGVSVGVALGLLMPQIIAS